jgi:uncharacterized protein
MEIATKKSKYAAIETLGLLVNSEVKADFSTINRPPKNAGEDIKKLRSELTDEQIAGKLSDCTALVLGITEQCNFRCRYCSYSGSYLGERKHSEKRMNFKTAKKAVDLFMKLIMQDTRKKKRHDIYIGFYGGEPLLEFDLIKKIIQYAENAAVNTGFHKRFDIVYRLNTNGYLLNVEKVAYFKEKNALVDVSLDGPEEEHDKFRVTASGRKTWGRIMKNLKRIKERYPGYYKQNISYLVTLHPHHNCKKIDRFFMDNRDLFYDKKVKLNPINMDALKNDEKEYLLKTAGPPSELYTAQSMQQYIDPKFKLKTRQPGDPLTGTCFPGGEKLFVSSLGALNICEKASEECPKIGHVNTGFDFGAIRQMMKEYNEEIIRNRCWECDYWFLCPVCLANAYKMGRFEFKCSIKKSHSPFLKKYLEKREEEDEKENLHPINRAADFIDQL